MNQLLLRPEAEYFYIHRKEVNNLFLFANEFVESMFNEDDIKEFFNIIVTYD